MLSESAPSGRRTGAKRAGGLLLWGGLLLAVAALRWPMLKGSYYKVSGVEAPASAIAWREDFDAAMAEASESGKPLLVDFAASWCPPCRVMEHDVWPDPGVSGAVNGRYIPVLIDVDDPEDAGVAERYGIVGIPAILVLDAEGRVLRRGGFMSSTQAIAFLDAGPGPRQTR
jgi:thiol:disulfide interchange protein